MKDCENDCAYYETRVCKEDGNIMFGYDEEGAEVCPMFTPHEKPNINDLIRSGKLKLVSVGFKKVHK